MASQSAASRSFLQNLDRILSCCSQLYINCLAILLFTETSQNRHLKRLHSIVHIVILSFLPALRKFLLPNVFDIFSYGWMVYVMYGFKVCSYIVKMLWPRCMANATVSSPFVVTTLLSSVTIATCFLELSWK